MDLREPFIETTRTITQAMLDMSGYRIVGNSIVVATLSVNVNEIASYPQPDTMAISYLRRISPRELYSFQKILSESSIALAYAWLDSYLSEVEEALLLSDPSSLGENIPVKLGKIISSNSIESLVHDLVRKRLRDRQISLKNRISDIRDRHGLEIDMKDEQLEWISSTRNLIIHNRRLGVFEVEGVSVTYKSVEQVAKVDAVEFLYLCFYLLRSLYTSCAKRLGIPDTNDRHSANLRMLHHVELAWKPNEKSDSD